MSQKSNNTKKKGKKEEKTGQCFPLATRSLVSVLRATAHMNQPGHKGAAASLWTSSRQI